MKKFLLLLLCCALCLCILSGCANRALEDDDDSSSELTSEEITSEESISEEITSEESSADEHEHAHVNYKGLVSSSVTLEDIAQAEGRSHNFTFQDSDETEVYVYNDVTMDNFAFDQVQFFLKESYVRISCTDSSSGDPASLLAQWREEMTQIYGEPSVNSDETLMSWSDHTGNYVTLTQLNDKTVQLCFYLVA